MTIDERLDRLADRHESLAQSVELLVHQVDRLEKHAEYVLGELHTTFAATNTAIGALLAVVQSHETRLSKLEG